MSWNETKSLRKDDSLTVGADRAGGYPAKRFKTLPVNATAADSTTAGYFLPQARHDELCLSKGPNRTRLWTRLFRQPTECRSRI